MTYLILNPVPPAPAHLQIRLNHGERRLKSSSRCPTLDHNSSLNTIFSSDPGARIVWETPETISICVTLFGDPEKDTLKAKKWVVQLVGVFSQEDDPEEEKEKILGRFDLDITERIKIMEPEIESIVLESKGSDNIQVRTCVMLSKSPQCIVQLRYSALNIGWQLSSLDVPTY